LKYLDGLLIYKKKFVSDKNDLIFLAEYDPITDKHLWAEKYYNDDEGNWIYTFIYNKDGSCFSIDRHGDEWVCDPGSEFMAKDIGTFRNRDFTWDGLEYYRNVEPIVPE